MVQLNNLVEASLLKELSAERQEAKRGSARFFKISYDDVREDFVVYRSKVAKNDRSFDWQIVRNVHFEGGQNVLLVHSSWRRRDSKFEARYKVGHDSSVGRRDNVVGFINNNVVKVVSRPLTESPRHGLDSGEHKVCIRIVAVVLVNFRSHDIVAKDSAEHLARLVKDFGPMGKIEHITVAGVAIGVPRGEVGLSQTRRHYDECAA